MMTITKNGEGKIRDRVSGHQQGKKMMTFTQKTS